jgi:tripartite-type tricarboxylate transporter receptor subunit TctC
MSIIRHAVAAALALAVALPVAAQQGGAFPVKPVRLIVPYPPGGGSDTIARPLAQKLSESYGQQVIVDNRGGAGVNVGMEMAAKAPPDGYTLAFALTAQLAVNPGLYRKLPYDPAKDYEPISLIASGPYLLVVHPSLPVKSVKDLVALARSRPGQLAYASSGNGSGGHLAAELMKSLAKIDLVHIPYKGGGPALVDVLAGQVQILFAPPASSAQHIQAGKLRSLGVTTAKRSASLPDVPTLAEAGVPGYDSGVWYGVLAPVNTPRDIVMRHHGELVKALNAPDYRKLLVANAIDPIGSSPEELGRFIRSEIAKWAKVIRDAKVQVD